MKLYEALRKLCLEHGNIIVQKKNLVYLLSDMGAFEELPGMREAMKSLVSGWYAKDLYAAGLRKDSDFYLARAEDVKKSLSAKGRLRKEIADYAVDSVSFAFGFADSVNEPQDQGADPFEHDTEHDALSFGVSGKAGSAVYGRTYNQPKTLRQYRMAAESGNSDAQEELAKLYFCGQGVKQSYAEAIRWLMKAAAQGHAEAQSLLGYMCEYGLGTAQSHTEAVKWYRSAAEKGDGNAQHNLGTMYRNGTGVLQDYAEAMKWYLKADEQGNLYAPNSIGEMYSNGLGVPRDYAEAVKWYP